MKRRVLSLLLAVAAVLSLAAPAFAMEAPDIFDEEVLAQQGEEAVPGEGEVQGPIDPAEPENEGGPVEGDVADAVADEPAPVEGDVPAVVASAPQDYGIMPALYEDGDLKMLEGMLEKAIQTAQTKQSDVNDGKYTEDSSEAFKKALEDAEALKTKGSSKDETVTVAEVTAAITALVDATTGLDLGATDKENNRLAELLADCKAIADKKDECAYKYKQSARTALDNAIKKGEAAQKSTVSEEDQRAKHEDVTKAITDLEKAFGDLSKTENQNKVTAAITSVGFYAKSAQAQSALKQLGQNSKTCDDNTAFVFFQKPKTDGSDEHHYYFKAILIRNGEEQQSVTMTADLGANSSFLSDGYLYWSTTGINGKNEGEGNKFKDQAIENGDQIKFILYTYAGEKYSEDVTLREEYSTTITVSTDNQLPKILEAVYELANGTHTFEKDGMIVVLDSDLSSNPGDGYNLELVTPDGKTKYDMEVTKNTGDKFTWSWKSGDEAQALKDAKAVLTVGDYTVNLYANEKKGDGTVTPKAKLVNSKTITVPGLDVDGEGGLREKYDEKVETYGDPITGYAPTSEVEKAQKALDAAKALLDAAATTPMTSAKKTEIDNAKSGLESGFTVSLKKAANADKLAALKAAIDQAKTLNSDGSTEQAFRDLKSALQAAETLYNARADKTEDDDSAIEEATKNLKEKISALSTADADFTDLDAAVTAADQVKEDSDTYNKYNPKLREAFEAALEAAKKEQEKKPSKPKAVDEQATINDLAQKLKDAQTKMTSAGKLADTTALEEAIKKAQAMKDADYEDLTAVKAALKEAQELVDSLPGESKQQEVANALHKLETAMSSAKKLEHAGQITDNSGGWKLENGIWHYYKGGQKVTNSWISYGGKWYFVDPETGDMATGWRKINGAMYYMDKSGVMQTGWLQAGGKWYWLEASGSLYKGGWKLIGKTWFYLSPEDGVMQSGWLLLGNTWYYLNQAHDGTFGAMRTGWVWVGGKWYYMNGSGAMQTGWLKLGSTWYYLNPTTTDTMPLGAMYANSWLLYGGAWYYLGGSGAMYANGRYSIGGVTYNFESWGAMTTGWRWYPGGIYRYFDASGAMIRNSWIYVVNKWYYMDGAGIMLTGVQKIGGQWYYFEPSGAMHIGWRDTGSYKCYYTGSGALVWGKWYVVDGVYYYFDSDGHMLKNTTKDGYRIGADGKSNRPVTA